MECFLAQILVIVAITEVKLFRSDESNGFFATVFGEELVDPKSMPHGSEGALAHLAKGKEVKIPPLV